MVSEESAESSKYTINIKHAEGIAIGDGAQVVDRCEGSLPSGVPFQVPPLSAHFVPRLEVSGSLKARLLDKEPTTPGVLVIGAVHGLGGVGKTTLVAALAHDPDLQVRFPDGILWATLGHEPDVLSLLVGWIQELSDYDLHPTVVESASGHLRTLLHDKVCLLVVDDAWQADHVRPFLGGGERCQVLVTTRDAILARKVGALLYDLDVMTEAQALALFQARLGPLEGNCEQAAALAKELGYLPLALELAAAQVEAGITWEELLAIFSRELADLAALDLDEATYRNESLRLCFRLSLERLSPENEEAFAWLGVLPEDARLNPTMAATLWDQSEAKARQRLRYLRDKALLKTARTTDIEQHTVHDLLHDEARLRLAERMPLSDAHAALLTRYRARTQNGLWHTLPDDGYIHEHLTWHLEQARQPEVIHTLLQEQTPEWRNGWYEARERLGQIAGYLADVARAWQLAEEQRSIGLQCHYALVTTSLNSLAVSLPPVLLASLMRDQLWSARQGIAFVRQVCSPGQRAQAIVAVAPHLPAELLDDALKIAREISDAGARTSAFVGLIDHLPEALGACVLNEAFVAAQQIAGHGARTRALAELLSQLSEPSRSDVLREALAEVGAIADDDARGAALVDLIQYLPEPLVRQEIDRALLATRANWERHTQEYPQHSSYVEWEETGANIPSKLLCSLAGRLAVLGRPEEAFAMVPKIWGQGWRAEAIARLAPYLPDALLQEALKTARAIRPPSWSADALVDALVALARRLQEPARSETLEEALELARAIPEGDICALALASLVPHLPEQSRQAALQEVQAAFPALESKSEEVRILAELSAELQEPVKGELLQKALETTYATEDLAERRRALAQLSVHLPKELLAAALKLSRGIGDERERARALVELAAFFSESGKGDGLLVALSESEKIPKLHDGFEIPNRRDETLKRLAQIAAETGHPDVVRQAAQAMEWESNRREALSWLTEHNSLGSAEVLKPEFERNADHSTTSLESMLARRCTREDLLSSIRAQAPVIADLGGQEGIAETFRAIQDVGRWWP